MVVVVVVVVVIWGGDTTKEVGATVPRADGIKGGPTVGGVGTSGWDGGDCGTEPQAGIPFGCPAI